MALTITQCQDGFAPLLLLISCFGVRQMKVYAEYAIDQCEMKKQKCTHDFILHPEQTVHTRLLSQPLNQNLM